MCGIVYMKSLVGENVSPMIKHQFRKQRSRGIDGFGFAYRNNKSVNVIHETEEELALKLLRKTKSTEILFHHRIPTSTTNVLNACHPFEVKGYKTGHKYIVVHNGMLWNEDELKEKHYKLGYKYRSIQKNGQFNDSEALAYEIMLAFENDAWEDFDAEGSIAFICQEVSRNGRPVAIHFARNDGSPLKMKYNGKTLQVASELNGESIEVNKLYSVAYKTMDIKTKDIKMEEGYSYYNTGYRPSEYPKTSYWDGEVDPNPSMAKAESYLPKEEFFRSKKKDRFEYFYDAGTDYVYTNYMKEFSIKSIEMLVEYIDKRISDLDVVIKDNTAVGAEFMNDYYEEDKKILENKSCYLYGMADAVYEYQY